MNALTTLSGVVTSLQLSEKTGKQHAHVMRDIRKVLDDLWKAGVLDSDTGRSKFGASEKTYLNTQGKPQTYLEMTTTLARTVVTRYNAVAAAKAMLYIEELEKQLGRGGVERVNVLPPHHERYQLNYDRVPLNHFSVLQEIGPDLMDRLHRAGCELSGRWHPDISVGRIFCAFLRDEHGVDTDSLPKYEHEYPDGRVVPANAYPNRYLGIYKDWFINVYMPGPGRALLAKREPTSLPYYDQLPALKGAVQ